MRNKVWCVYRPLWSSICQSINRHCPPKYEDCFVVWFVSPILFRIASLVHCLSECPRGHGPLARYVNLRVAHAPGTFSPPPQNRDPGMHHGTCVTHVPWCMPGSQTCVFHWSWWRGKRSRQSRRMRNTQFYVSGKRPMHQNWGIWVNRTIPSNSKTQKSTNCLHICGCTASQFLLVLLTETC